jgi:hypothetical protein
MKIWHAAICVLVVWCITFAFRLRTIEEDQRWMRRECFICAKQRTIKKLQSERDPNTHYIFYNCRFQGDPNED